MVMIELCAVWQACIYWIR